jgi:hypothetical protein
MAKTRQNEHSEDIAEFKGKHIPTESTEDGACLTGHNARRNKGGRLAASSCNYRWQAFRQALEHDKTNYNSPKYASLLGSPTPVTTRVRRGVTQVTNLQDKAWDVSETSDNFQTSCNTPYWHEAHHIVPHGELRDAMVAVGEGPKAAEFRKLIRGGLLDEKYNLNHKTNMIILPLDDKIATVLSLPRHRHTSRHISHKAYSTYVRNKLNEVFKSMRQGEDQHAALPDYKASRTQIENISKTTRTEIENAGGLVSLDEAFGPKQPDPA